MKYVLPFLITGVIMFAVGNSEGGAAVLCATFVVLIYNFLLETARTVYERYFMDLR